MKLIIKALRVFKSIFELMYSKLIIAELIIRQHIFKQVFLFRLGGFGDLLLFIIYCKRYHQNLKYLNLGSVQGNILNTFVEKKKIINIFFKIPHYRFYYPIFFLVFASRYINKTKTNVRKLLDVENTQKIKNYILRSSQIKISVDHLKYLNVKLSKKYICFFVKDLVDKNYNWIDSINTKYSYSSEKSKIMKILYFLIKKKINILILGDNEGGTNFLYAKIKNNKNFANKIFFIRDYVKYFDINNKIILYNNSMGFIGNGSGHCEYFYFLRKKTIIFDYLESVRVNKTEYDSLNKNLRKVLIKKIFEKKTKKWLPIKFLCKIILDLQSNNKIFNKFYKKKYMIQSNNIIEIRNTIKKFFIIK
jgi:hypothetical protein